MSLDLAWAPSLGLWFPICICSGPQTGSLQNSVQWYHCDPGPETPHLLAQSKQKSFLYCNIKCDKPWRNVTCICQMRPISGSLTISVFSKITQFNTCDIYVYIFQIYTLMLKWLPWNFFQINIIFPKHKDRCPTCYWGFYLTGGGLQNCCIFHGKLWKFAVLGWLPVLLISHKTYIFFWQINHDRILRGICSNIYFWKFRINIFHKLKTLAKTFKLNAR